MRHAPHLSPGAAGQFLALIEHARAVAPDSPLEYLRGFLLARATELTMPIDPRRESEPPSADVVIGRVRLERR